jgi:hypothetical protein
MQLNESGVSLEGGSAAVRDTGGEERPGICVDEEARRVERLSVAEARQYGACLVDCPRTDGWSKVLRRSGPDLICN